MSVCSEHGLPNSSLCKSMTWTFVNSNFTPLTYVGSVCRRYLLAWQDCTIGPSFVDNNISISVFESQAEIEQLAVEAYPLIGWCLLRGGLISQVYTYNVDQG